VPKRTWGVVSGVRKQPWRPLITEATPRWRAISSSGAARTPGSATAARADQPRRAGPMATGHDVRFAVASGQGAVGLHHLADAGHHLFLGGDERPTNHHDPGFEQADGVRTAPRSSRPARRTRLTAVGRRSHRATASATVDTSWPAARRSGPAPSHRARLHTPALPQRHSGGAVLAVTVFFELMWPMSPSAPSHPGTPPPGGLLPAGADPGCPP